MSPAAHATVQPLDDRAVVVDFRTGRCWELNNVGFAIWRQLSGGGSVAEAAAAISAQYSVPADVSKQDVLTFVLSLVGEGLLVISPAAGSEPVVP